MSLLEGNILAKRGRIGISGQALAALLGVSETYLSRGLSGIKPLPGHELLRIDRTLNDLIDIASIIAPLAIPTDVATLKILLRKYEDNGLAALRNLDTLVEMRGQVAELRRI